MEQKMEQKKTANTEEAIGRYANGLYVRADAEALRQALACGKGYEQAGKVMDRVWDDFTAAADAAAAADATPTQQQHFREEARQLLKRLRRQEKRRSLRYVRKYAAAVVALVIVAGALYFFSADRTEADPPWTTIRVKHGQQEQILLPDGTKATLNVGTTFSYPPSFRGEKRAVRLDGEAFFDVARNRAQRFVVQAGDADIEALGTSFNVKAYDEDDFIAVTVESGKVKVDTEDAMMQLLPDEQLFFDKTRREMRRNRENTAKTKAWISGELYFNKTPIRNVINELMRRYDCVIKFEGGKIPDEYLSGVHDNKTLEAVLNSIHYATGIKYRKEENGQIVLYENK
jgi:ferric-dicitrate binding protein FerR (iron transport regulator)